MATMLDATIEQQPQLLRDQIERAGVNLVMLGFPKCGTTAFAEWLDGSRYVAVSHPKETFQLCPEFSVNLQRSEQVELADSYHSSDALWRVEATTLNVYSRSLRAALTDTPTKVVLLVRDPVESVISWHNQMFQAGTAVSERFEDAWEYALGMNQEPTEGVEFLRAYELVCSYGRWVSQWLSAVGHDRMLLLYDYEVRKNPHLLQQRIEAFLSCRLELPEAVPVRNQFSSIRFPRAYALLRRPIVKSVLRNSAKYLPIVDGFRRFVRERIMLRPAQKKTAATSENTHLVERFADDQRILAAIYQQNTQRWPSTPATA